jgi:hypothetical protein
MSTSRDGDGPIDEADLEFDERTLRRIRERGLQAEKEKLNLDNPRGIINDLESIVREEID